MRRSNPNVADFETPQSSGAEFIVVVAAVLCAVTTALYVFAVGFQGVLTP